MSFTKLLSGFSESSLERKYSVGPASQKSFSAGDNSLRVVVSQTRREKLILLSMNMTVRGAMSK